MSTFPRREVVCITSQPDNPARAIDLETGACHATHALTIVGARTHARSGEQRGRAVVHTRLEIKQAANPAVSNSIRRDVEGLFIYSR